MEKICTKCKELKPFESFSKKPTAKSGLRSKCKVCSNKENKLYKLQNPEKIIEYGKLYQLKNKEKVKVWLNTYRLKNLQKVQAAKKRCILKNPEKYKIIQKKSRIKVIAELKDCYIKDKLVRQGFPPNSITSELIEVKRLIIKTQRLCKISQS